MSGACPDGGGVPEAHRGPYRSCGQPLRQGQRTDGGLVTLERLLIMGAIAGLAASSVLIVQRVTDEQTEVPEDPLVRVLEADIAAAAVAAAAQADIDDTSAVYTDTVFANRCDDVRGDYSDVVNGAAWESPAGPDGIPRNADDVPARCTVTPKSDLGA